MPHRSYQSASIDSSTPQKKSLWSACGPWTPRSPAFPEGDDGHPLQKLLSTLGPEQKAQLMALLHQKEEIAAPN